MNNLDAVVNGQTKEELDSSRDDMRRFEQTVEDYLRAVMDGSDCLTKSNFSDQIAHYGAVYVNNEPGNPIYIITGAELLEDDAGFVSARLRVRSVLYLEGEIPREWEFKVLNRVLESRPRLQDCLFIQRDDAHHLIMAHQAVQDRYERLKELGRKHEEESG